ncbi:MAG: (d)CMP kinase [Clostridia bacterium]|nr:(d)CMP kinase [Clostridia bacterium]
MIIAVDGTSGSGKSTFAKKLAKELDFGFFSAGALYRAITVKVLNFGVNENDDEALKNLIENTNIEYKYHNGKITMKVDGIDVSNDLWSETVSNFVAKIACKPFIREFVRSLQRKTKQDNENIVMEGRDIGSVIFPDADLKIYVDCKVEERAKRRLADYKNRGENVTLETVIEDLKSRDYADTHRELSPLVMVKDAYLIDTTHIDADEAVNLALEEMKRRNLI